MLIGLKMSVLTCIHVFYRPGYNIKWGLHGIECWRSWNAEMKKINDRTQRVEEKSGVICLVIMLTPRVTNIKMSQMAHCFVFSANGSKKIVRIRTKYLSAPKRTYCVLSENGIVNILWRYRLWEIRGRNIRKTTKSVKKRNSVCSRVDILLMVAHKPIIYSIF